MVHHYMEDHPDYASDWSAPPPSPVRSEPDIVPPIDFVPPSTLLPNDAQVKELVYDALMLFFFGALFAFLVCYMSFNSAMQFCTVQY